MHYLISIFLGFVWEKSFLKGEGFLESIKIFEDLRCNYVVLLSSLHTNPISTAPIMYIAPATVVPLREVEPHVGRKGFIDHGRRLSSDNTVFRCISITRQGAIE